MYRVELSSRAQRELKELRGKEFDDVVAALRGLQNNPRPLGVKKLRGTIHRIRVGDWRIIYAVFDKDGLVIVGKVARRSEKTYNKLDRLF
ncbi:MAG: type II toxin-antitoxin system RelE family toxin [Chloroflexota bacterium]